MLPESGKFGFAKPEMPIEDVLKTVEFLLKEVAVANDLPPSTFSVEPQPESGRAKLIESSALIEAREDDVGLWRAYERQLFDLLKTIINTHEPGTVPEAATIAVDFGEILPVTTERRLSRRGINSPRRRV